MITINYLIIGNHAKNSFLGEEYRDQKIGLKFEKAVRFHDEVHAKDMLRKLQEYKTKNPDYTPEVVQTYRVYRVNVIIEKMSEEICQV